jgi:2-polyprenyl-6-methoxyphenol hydroxylase-like FAD-dependent oxidoreductase
VELARQGVDVTVIDKRDEASGFSRAVGILQSTLDLLQPSGVSDALREEGINVRRARVFRDAKQVFDFRLSWDERDEQGFILCLPQDRTEAHLREAFIKYGGDLRMSTALEDIEQDEDHVTAYFGKGKTEIFDYALGADGTRSKVREVLGLAYNGFDLPEDWSIADADVVDWAYPETFTIFKRSGSTMVIAVPMAPNRIRFISNTKDALETLPIKVNVANLRRSGTFKISIRQVDEYRKGRILLAGDAAHSHSPAGGRGMNLGIADACAFADGLINETLDNYSAERHAEGAKIIRASETARKIVTAQSKVGRFVLFGILRVIGLFPRLVTALARRVILR